MHKFLPAIGFSKLNKESLEKLIEEIKLRPDYQECALNSDGSQFAELRYMVADNIGLVLRGNFDEKDQFNLDYYYPTCFGENISSNGDVEVIKQTDKENYYVICDEIKLGVSLIFQLQNMGEFLRASLNDNKGDTNGIRLAALSCEGKVILPIYNTEKSKIKTKTNQQRRLDLVEQAKNGDEGAMESLTLDEIDLYAKISRRISKNDILTVVTSYFMPYGIENDKYEILGEILEIRSQVNHLTMEELWILTVNCNDVIFDLCINKKDLYGEPAIGRRFKGTIWLQGHVNFT